jgi:NAD(P)-dependent dehydrogenase (short-subunit alcohol dehydrogenase family)
MPRVWVISHDPGVAERLAQGLEDCRTFSGAKVVDEARLALESEQPKLVLISLLHPGLFVVRPIEALSAQDWREVVHTPAKQLFVLVKLLGSALSEANVALVGPTLGNVGAENLVPLCTVLEGQRGFAKSVARQWGERGMRMSWIGVAPEAYGLGLEEADVPTSPEFGPAHRAIGRVPNLAEAAGVAALLATPQGRVTAGTSINVDGGEWMLP